MLVLISPLLNCEYTFLCRVCITYPLDVVFFVLIVQFHLMLILLDQLQLNFEYFFYKFRNGRIFMTNQVIELIIPSFAKLFEQELSFSVV